VTAKVVGLVLGVAVGTAALTSPVSTQRQSPGSQGELSPDELRAQTKADMAVALAPLPKVDATTSRGWPLNNLDTANSRYSLLTQINSTNVRSLAVKWLHRTRNAGSTPIVVDGVMYITSPQSVTAVDAATGKTIWNSTAAGSGRGAAYGDGRIYVATADRVAALDARTGEPIAGFGEKGISHALTHILKERFPQLAKPAEWGYSFNMAPQYHDGVLVVATALSENHIPGGLVLALDAKTGAPLWKFWGVPQGPGDEGWEIAKDTWIGGVRHGGGVWATPAIDTQSNTVHLTVANPSPDQDGSARKGINLFSNAFVTLDLKTGKLKWYFQQIHHDLWDYDAGQQPTLFDVPVNGRTVRATAAANKNGFVYILDRDTGKPINPIVETPVPTATETPGEEVWPTQPIPHTASGKVMVPTASQVVEDVYPRYAEYPKLPFYTPPTRKGAVHAPREAVHYGANSFSPRTNLLYVAGKNLPIFMTAIPTGNTLKNGQFSTAGRRESAARETGNVSAYDPATGEMKWRTAIGGGPSAGTFATAGNHVFAGDRQGMFYAFDAGTGALLWSFDTGASIRGGQITYQVNGVQYLAVPSGGDVILAMTLLDRTP